jgi:pimeloyl-ACP methyl ester carboxylesterase
VNDHDAANYDEFAFLEQYARHEGLPWNGAPVVARHSVEVAPGQNISALKWGEDDPEIVLLHGGGQNAHTWDSVAMALGRPLIAFDLPGHGHSSWREDGDYRPSENAAAIAAAMQQLAPAPDTVVGMSLGGMTAISLAANHPDRVGRLVLVDITPGTGSRVGEMTREQRGATVLMSGPPMFDSFDEILATTAAAVPGRPVETLRPGVLHNSKQLEDGRWTWRYDRLRNPARDPDELWAELARTSAPTMLVKGGKSVMVHDDDVAEFQRIRPGTRYEVVEGAGHSVQSDRASRLAELIAEFRASR